MTGEPFSTRPIDTPTKLRTQTRMDQLSWDLVSKIAVALSAIVAVATFAISTYRENQRRREAEVREWQIVVLQRVFAREQRAWLTFDHLMQRYRTEASAFQGHNLPKKELSEDALRRVLTEMVRGRLIDQRANDEYQLQTWDKGADPFPGEFLGAMQGLITQFTGLRDKGHPGILGDVGNILRDRMESELKIFDRAMNMVGEDPGRYSISDLTVRLSREFSVEAEIVSSKLFTMIRSDQLIENNGKLALATSPLLGL